MQVILQQDIPTLGHKGDVVSVKNGYGRNFLIPKGMASLATATAALPGRRQKGGRRRDGNHDHEGPAQTWR